MINQREVRVDTEDFAVALRAAMRQDPDVILVGEMRDPRRSRRPSRRPRPATSSCRRCTPPTRRRPINRIIDFFPPHEQKQVRLSLAGALRGIVCQRLVPRADGAGRCVAMEVCVNTGRIADAIADPERPRRSTS